MFGLDTITLSLLIICLICACAFEFVNGFHDTANAVATVIYTNSLKPMTAVVWSGICNFLGVFAGGIAVAMGIVNLLPVEVLTDQNVYHSIAMILALIVSAIAWNLGTWYVGLPSSSSHTLVGSILGVGLAYSFMPDNSTGAGVNWSKAADIGMSLLISPLFGFGMTLLLIYILKKSIKNKVFFEEPNKEKAPPIFVRSLLILTCTLVSFFHGSNDGQKGVGLVMVILIAIIPGYYAINENQDPVKSYNNIVKIEQVVSNLDTSKFSAKEMKLYNTAVKNFSSIHGILEGKKTYESISNDDRFKVRKGILLGSKACEKLIESGATGLNKEGISSLKSEIKGAKKLTDFAPRWVIIMISVSLGLGTMIGWKRIVRTIGEKIGKSHLSYAQGASAELVAASTIGLSTWLGLPVSTTHVLSSGIAGSMVGDRGIGNLQPKTIRNIVTAWVLTLPVTMLLSGLLFILFRAIL